MKCRISVMVRIIHSLCINKDIAILLVFAYVFLVGVKLYCTIATVNKMNVLNLYHIKGGEIKYKVNC